MYQILHSRTPFSSFLSSATGLTKQDLGDRLCRICHLSAIVPKSSLLQFGLVRSLASDASLADRGLAVRIPALRACWQWALEGVELEPARERGREEELGLGASGSGFG